MFKDNASTQSPETPSALALDAQWLAARLQQHLWRAGEEARPIAQVEILHVRETGRGMTVLYQIDLQPGGPPPSSLLYVGYAVGRDAYEEEYRALARKGKIQPPLGKTVIELPEARLVLLAYPNDRKMRLLANENLRERLGASWREIANGVLDPEQDWQLQEASLEMLRYVPERRFTALCRAQLQSAGGVQQEVLFIAKQVNDEQRARRLYRHLTTLRRAWPGNPAARGQARGNPPMRLPRALLLERERAVVFIEYVAGENLKELLPVLDLATVMPAVGKLLADFHRAQKRVRKRISPRSELVEGRKAMREICQSFPGMRPRLKKFFAKLKNCYRHDATAPVLLHGSYRLNHIFLHRDELALLDLDGLRMGPPAYDLANFISSLYYLEAQERFETAQRREIARHVLAGYAAHAAAAVAPASVLWFLASLLVNKQARKYVTHLIDKREEKTSRMLALAEAALEACQAVPQDLPLPELWSKLP